MKLNLFTGLNGWHVFGIIIIIIVNIGFIWRNSKENPFDETQLKLEALIKVLIKHELITGQELQEELDKLKKKKK